GAAVRGDHEVVILDDDVGDLYVGKVERERVPVGAVVPGDVGTVLRSGVQQAGASRVFAHHVDVVVATHPRDDLRPGAAEVMCSIDVGRPVVVLIILGGEIRRGRVMRRRVDHADAG